MFQEHIARLDTISMSLTQWLGAFLGVVWIRYALESFSSPTDSGFLPIDLSTLVHYTVFYLAAIFLSVWLISAVVQIDTLRMTRTLLFVLPIMWLPPLIDLALGGARVTYIFTSDARELAVSFLTYFGSLGTPVITPGIRIELAILIVLFGIYTFAQTGSKVSAFTAAFLQYVWLFVLACLPSILTFFFPDRNLVHGLQSSLLANNVAFPADLGRSLRSLELLFNGAVTQLLYVVLCVAIVGWLSRVDGQMFRAIRRNLRPERIAHFLLMVILGAAFAVRLGADIQWTVLDMVTVSVTLFTVLFACLFAIAVNDLVDVPIDTVSNRARPLITGELSAAQMRQVSGVSAGMMALGGLALGPYSFFFVGAFTAAYYVYSAPPLRLKRIPVFSSWLIGVASLAMFALGFYLVSPQQQLSAFPGGIGMLIVVAMTLITNVRDLKDVEGDGRAGISTLPTLLGEHRSRWLMGAFTFVAYMLVPLVFPIAIVSSLSVLAGLTSWVGLVRGGGEKLIFALYFSYLAALVGVLAVVV